jgi:capsular polysaccharide biosynthesis protein
LLTLFLRFLVYVLSRLGTVRLEIAVLRWAINSGVADEAMTHALVARAEPVEDTHALIDAYSALLRIDPADVFTATKLGQAHLAVGNVGHAEAAYAQADQVTCQSPTVLYRSAHMDRARAAQGEPYVGELRNVLLETNHCAVFQGRCVYWREISGRNIANHPIVHATTADLSIVAARLPSVTGTIDRPVILIGTDGAYNYSHWLSRNVLKLSLVEEDARFASLPILINHDLSAYQREYLELLAISSDRLLGLPENAVIACRELFVPTNFRGHPRMGTAIDWLRGRLSRFIAPSEAAIDRIYISRRDSRQRVLLNEQELETALAQLGFRIVTLTGMPVRDQIALFSRAKFIVGAHGAGLTNLMFAPRGATVVEITNTKIRHMRDFRSIAFHMNQRHIEVVSGSYPVRQPDRVLREVQKFDYFTNVDDVLAAVDEAIALPA